MTLEIVLTVPAHAAYLRYLRVVAATVADDVGLDTDGVERVRMAVDELAALAIGDAAEGALLHLRLCPTADAVTIEGTCSPVTAGPEIDAIAAKLIERGAHEYRISLEGDTVTFDMVRRLR